MNAETIAYALGGRKAGSGWTARCPAHEDRTPSLSIRDSTTERYLVRCHAGCEQEQVIAGLQARGLWTERGLRSYSRQRRPYRRRQSDKDDVRRTKVALAIWRSSIRRAER